MAENKNYFRVDGVVFAKPVKEGISKKGEPYSIPSLILEIKSIYKDKIYSTTPEFILGKGVGVDDYAIGDMVTVTFALEGKTRKYNGKEWIDTHPRAIYVKHADLDANRDTHQGNVPVDNTFVAPEPGAEEDFSDLPF